MAFCIKCGKALKEGAKFCASCGAEVKGGAAKTTSKQATQKADTASTASKQTAQKTATKVVEEDNMPAVKKISEIKALAKKQIKGKRGEALLVCLLRAAVIGFSSALVVGPFILGGPLSLGFSGYFLNRARGKSADIGDLFDAFKGIGGGNSQFGQSIILHIVKGIFLFLWSLLLIVPGIIKSMSYSQTFYIMKDKLGISGMDAITESRKMMNGHKGRYFLLGLSFIGWFLLFLSPSVLAFVFPDAGAIFIGLGTIAMFAGSIWLLPYVIMCYTIFYVGLRNMGAKR